MTIKIDEIKINPGRRKIEPGNVQSLADSIKEVGLLNPITVTADHTLIAGRHRLEAAKLLGWTEIECTVNDVDGLLAELAEIDENCVRSSLSPIEFGDLLLRRKQIYETLHPETKKGTAQAARMNKSLGRNVTAKMTATSKSFVDDTAERFGVSPRTVRREIQTAENLTPAAKEIIRKAGSEITKTEALEISRLKPEQQARAAELLLARKVEPIKEKPYKPDEEVFATLEETIADLKNPNKDTRYTPDSLLSDMDSNIENVHEFLDWYFMPMCTVVFPDINQKQLEFVRKRFGTLTSKIERLLTEIEKSMKDA